MTQNTIELDNLQANDDVATDRVSNREYQQIKIVNGAIDSVTPVEVGGGLEANALRVTLASDSTGQVTIDGTVTANLSAEDNSVLDAIQAAVEIIDNAIAGTEMRVDVITSALPTGAATAANQTTIIGHVDGIEGLLTTIDADTGNLPTIETNTDFGTVVGNGTAVGALRVTVASDSTGAIAVDLGANNDIQGDRAHNDTDSGNPVKIGAKASNNIEGVTQVANNDRTDLLADLNGCIVTRPHTTLEEILSDRVAPTTTTAAEFTDFTTVAGIHNYVTTISIYNSSAVDVYVDIKNGTAGSILFTAAAPAGGGSVITFPVPLKGEVNTHLSYQLSAAASTVYISIVGFQAQG